MGVDESAFTKATVVGEHTSKDVRRPVNRKPVSSHYSSAVVECLCSRVGKQLNARDLFRQWFALLPEIGAKSA